MGKCKEPERINDTAKLQAEVALSVSRGGPELGCSSHLKNALPRTEPVPAVSFSSRRSHVSMPVSMSIPTGAAFSVSLSPASSHLGPFEALPPRDLLSKADSIVSHFSFLKILLFLSPLYTQCGAGTQHGDQESHALPPEPARHPSHVTLSKERKQSVSPCSCFPVISALTVEAQPSLVTPTHLPSHRDIPAWDALSTRHSSNTPHTGSLRPLGSHSHPHST